MHDRDTNEATNESLNESDPSRKRGPARGATYVSTNERIADLSGRIASFPEGIMVAMVATIAESWGITERRTRMVTHEAEARGEIEIVYRRQAGDHASQCAVGERFGMNGANIYVHRSSPFFGAPHEEIRRIIAERMAEENGTTVESRELRDPWLNRNTLAKIEASRHTINASAPGRSDEDSIDVSEDSESINAANPSSPVASENERESTWHPCAGDFEPWSDVDARACARVRTNRPLDRPPDPRKKTLDAFTSPS